MQASPSSEGPGINIEFNTVYDSVATAIDTRTSLTGGQDGRGERAGWTRGESRSRSGIGEAARCAVGKQSSEGETLCSDIIEGVSGGKGHSYGISGEEEGVRNKSGNGLDPECIRIQLLCSSPASYPER